MGKKIKRYEVTLVREVEHRAVVEVEAESEDVAKSIAEDMADARGACYWREGDTTSYTVKAKVLR